MKYTTSKSIMEDLYKNGGEKEYWCCVLYYSDYTKIATRNISPKKVQLLLDMKKYAEYIKNSHGMPNYSWIKTVSLNSKNKKSLSFSGKCAGGYDNLVIFDTEEECQEFYNTKVFNSIIKIEEEKQQLLSKIDSRINKLKKSFYNSDYVMETLRRN